MLQQLDLWFKSGRVKFICYRIGDARAVGTNRGGAVISDESAEAAGKFGRKKDVPPESASAENVALTMGGRVNRSPVSSDRKAHRFKP